MPELPVRLFAVPRRGRTMLCAVEGGRLADLGPLPMPPLAEHAISDTGWIAWPEDEGRTIRRAHCDAEPAEQKFPPIRLPDGYSAATLAFHGQALYVGGGCGMEVLGLYAYHDPEPAWVPLPVPEEFRRHGKRVDDLLVDGTRLIAVDDIIVPQYLLLYDVRAPLAPALDRVVELTYHTTYEHIEKGALGGPWLALLSSGISSGGESSHVGLYGRDALVPLGSISTGRRRGHSHTWLDLEMCGETLLIAAGEAGVGVLDLGAVERPSPMAWDAESHEWAVGQGGERFMQECERRLRYVPLAAGPVVRLLTVPTTRHVLAVVRTEGGPDTVVIDVDGLLA